MDPNGLIWMKIIQIWIYKAGDNEVCDSYLVKTYLTVFRWIHIGIRIGSRGMNMIQGRIQICKTGDNKVCDSYLVKTDC